MVAVLSCNALVSSSAVDLREEDLYLFHNDKSGRAMNSASGERKGHGFSGIYLHV